jgi:Spy/CpxP family protein refolding chaperone
MVQRLSRRLNLTPDQQKQARAMFRDAFMQAKPLRAQMHQERASLNMAVKADSEQQIDQITHQNADVLAQLQAIHAKSMAKFYSILTPDQKARFDAMHSPNARTRAANSHNG